MDLKFQPFAITNIHEHIAESRVRYEAFKTEWRVSLRNRTWRNSSETDLRTRCRGRCRSVSRDSVYIVLRDRETPDRPPVPLSADQIYGVFHGEERRQFPVIHASLFSAVGGATQIRRTPFHERIDRNKYLFSIYPAALDAIAFLCSYSEYIRCR